MALMGWDLDATIGKLHRFWWWCLKYAEDGDLRKHNDSRLAVAMGVAMDNSKKLVEAMVQSCWIDREPYFRVHDWWEYAGLLLQIRYKHDAKKWKRVRSLYDGKSKNGSNNGSKNSTPTNQPTRPTRPTKRDGAQGGEVDIPEELLPDREAILAWLTYKREKGQTYKTSGRNALWRRLREIPQGQRKAAVEHSMANNWAGIYEPKKGTGYTGPDPKVVERERRERWVKAGLSACHGAPVQSDDDGVPRCVSCVGKVEMMVKT